MSEWLLFTDGSVNTQTKNGCGAALLTTSDSHTHTLNELRARIQIHEFTQTSSTKIELQTLLCALENVPVTCSPLTVYTDSQNILGLVDRRAGFEAQNYQTKKGLRLGNATLYQAFFKMADDMGFKLVKVKGHKSVAQRDAIDRLFNLVDKASRAACKQLHREAKA
ncbi:RNase H family protein [Coraliomargarita sp. W4R53]